MTINRRFSLNEDRYIIDSLSSANNLSGYCHEGEPEDDKHLRERVLRTRLAELVDDLIINSAPTQRLPNGEAYQPICEERHSICEALYHAITASHLNTLDVGLSLQHKFNGELKREKRGMQGSTSLSLFVDDVERLLRDLYGESDDQVIDLARRAVFAIVEEFTKYVRNDLWREHRSAQDFDYVFGIGLLPEGYGLNGSDHRRMLRAVHDLTERARSVRADPTKFSRYTVSFVNELYEEDWPPLTRPPESPEDRLSDTYAGEIPY